MTELDRQILDLGKKEKTLKKIFKKKINPFVSNAFLTVLVPYGFLMFSGGRERVHWERIGLDKFFFLITTSNENNFIYSSLKPLTGG